MKRLLKKLLISRTPIAYGRKLAQTNGKPSLSHDGTEEPYLQAPPVANFVTRTIVLI
jgi:hypothetical protein